MCGRNSISTEVDPEYFEMSVNRLRDTLTSAAQSSLDLTD
jgi:hypothetical protein